MLNLNLIKKVKNIFFPFYRNSDLKLLFKILQKDLYDKRVIMFVGGCVRKYLTKEEIDDIDVATSLTTTQIKEKLRDTKFKIHDSGTKHGTVTIISEKLKIEITTLRKDIRTYGRHAEVEYINDWQIDSERRDFTINAIYLDINGKIFDPQNGYADLKDKTLKFIGDPQKRISEDYLRIIRFLRFALDYKIKDDQKTFEAIKCNLDGIKKISKERILSELFKILKSKKFIFINQNKELSEIFSLIFPEFKHLKRLNKLIRIKDLENFSTLLLLAILLIDESTNHEYFAHKYNVSNELNESLNLLAKDFLHLIEKRNFFTKDLKKNIYLYGKNHLELLNILNFSITKSFKIDQFLNIMKDIEKTNVPVFPYDGNFLKKQGFKEGVILGKVLKKIELEWIKNNFNISEEKILKIIKEHIN